jgi:hypothetical protein
MIKKVRTAIAAALTGLSAVSCGMMSGDMGTSGRSAAGAGGASSGDVCAGLTGTEHQRCMQQQSGGSGAWPSDAGASGY